MIFNGYVAFDLPLDYIQEVLTERLANFHSDAIDLSRYINTTL